jgi:hypothetical protein
MIFSKQNINSITSSYLNQKKAGQVQSGGESLNLRQTISADTEDFYTDPQFSINSAVAVISENDKSALVRLLQRQGSFVTPLSSKKSLIDATFKAIQDSPKFREELQSYIIGEVTGTPIFKPKSQTNSALIRVAQNLPNLKRDRLSKVESLTSNFSSFTDFDDNFANQTKEKT